MQNKFILNPLKIVVLDPRGNKTLSTFCLIGEPPKNILDAINHVDSTQKDIAKWENMLSEYYGKQWKQKLGVTKNKDPSSPEKIGSGDATFIDPSEVTNIHETTQSSSTNLLTTIENDVEIAAAAILASPIEDIILWPAMVSGLGEDIDIHVNPICGKVGGDDFDDAELEMLLADDTPQDEITISKADQQKISSNKAYSFHQSPSPVGLKRLKHPKIYPEDTLANLTEKIYACSKIPPYRQHVFYKSKDRIHILYKLVTDEIHYVDIVEACRDPKTTTFSIPIDKKLYDDRQIMKIISLDSFKILSDIVIENDTIYVVDLALFLSEARLQIKAAMSDEYQISLLYYGFVVKFWPQLTRQCFVDYLIDEDDLRYKYPNLSKPLSILNPMLDAESNIIDYIYKNANAVHNWGLKNMSFAIIQMNATVKTSSCLLNIRNLFDKLSITPLIVEIKAYVSHNNKNYVLCKKQKHATPILFPALATYRAGITIACKAANEDKILFFNIRPNGSYFIKVTWFEEDGVDLQRGIEVVQKTCNPIVDTVNKFGHYVFMNAELLPQVGHKNLIFQGMNIDIDWKKSMTSQTYKMIRDKLAEWSRAGILHIRLGTTEKYEFAFRKGMHGYDRNLVEKIVVAAGSTLQNYYARLSDPLIKQKWDQHYDGRILKMEHRTTGIKFEIYGVHEVEFDIVFSYLSSFLYKMSHEGLKTVVNVQSKNVRKLKKLQETDPELYKLKKHGVNKVYSRICMKSHQPTVYSKEEVDEMSDKSLKKIYKYHNFTSNQPAYYACNNSEYPNFSFLTNVHPKGYCLPCCSKKTKSDEVGRKKKIFDECLAKKSFKVDKNLGKARHIMDYGKNIDPGRLAKLPSILGGLLFDSIDYPNKFVILGVDQNTKDGVSSGLVNSIATCLDMSTADLVISLAKRIDDKMFGYIFKGRLPEHFESRSDFVDTMVEIFVKHRSFSVGNVKWNKIFAELVYVCGFCGIFLFVDRSKDGVDINLDISVDFWNELENGNRPSGTKNIIVMRTLEKYYPIVGLSEDAYFKFGQIQSKSFAHGDRVSCVLEKLALHGQTNDQLLYNLKTVEDFWNQSDKKMSMADDPVNCKTSQHHSSDKIKMKYVNRSNKCYAILIEYLNSEIYLPVDYSSYSADGTPITFAPFSSTQHSIKFSVLDSFVEKFNQFLRIIQKETIVWTHKIALLNKDNIVGVVATFSAGTQMRYFCSEVTGEKVDQLPIMVDQHNFETVNQHIADQSAPTIDHRSEKLGRSVYDNFEYHLFVVEFVNHIEKEKNDKVRDSLKKILLEADPKNIQPTKAAIKNLVDKTDFVSIMKRVNSYRHDVKRMTDEILAAKYDFDKITFQKVRSMKHADVKKMLMSIVSEFAVEGSITDDKFPNMFVACEEMGKTSYCRDGKFITSNLDKMCDLLAFDLTNQLKSKYFFDNIWGSTIVDYFKFVERPNEAITVELVIAK